MSTYRRFVTLGFLVEGATMLQWSGCEYLRFLLKVCILNQQKSIYYTFFLILICIRQREKEGDLTQSYDKTPYTNRKIRNQRTTHERHQKLRLHNDCGPT